MPNDLKRMTAFGLNRGAGPVTAEHDQCYQVRIFAMVGTIYHRHEAFEGCNHEYQR